MKQDIEGIEFRKLQEFADFRGKTVLEIGCGDGRATAMLAPLAGRLVAIDPNEDRLKMARAKAPGADFRRGIGEDLEFSDESFDVVAFTFSLHHQDCARALAEARRVLKSSGQMVIIEPAIEGDMHPLFRVFRDEDAQILAVLKAIDKCGLWCERRETFDIEYLFDDAEEVYDYFFGAYGMARNDAHTERMRVKLSTRDRERPIRLVETVNMFCLVKI